jgi:8-oxo-dGTP pyrophosphatase MutT (NUDIX family)
VKAFSQPPKPVRVSVKAVIIVRARVLTVRNVDDRGHWYLLPGGGQTPGETLPEALSRECSEETGTGVLMGRLLFIRDYIGRNHEFAATDGDAHQLELMFECRLPRGAVPAVGAAPDPYQDGIEWLPLDRLEDYRIYPSALRRLLARPLPDRAVYLGDVN